MSKLSIQGISVEKILICLTEQEIKLLKDNSEESGLSVSEIIRRILDEHYTKENKCQKK